MSRKPRFIDRLDAVAERTGIPQAATGHPRRRHLRWLPVVPLAMGLGGFLAALLDGRLQSIGLTVVMLAFGLSVMLPLLGPIKPWGSAEHVDEFDREMRSRAFFFTFATMSLVAMLGIGLMIGITLMSASPFSVPTVQLGVLGALMFVLYSSLPTLHASWATRPIDDE